MNAEKTKMIFNDGLQFIGKEDYENVKEYFKVDPEDYDFKKILNW
jgi:hypothetical protein